MLHICLQWISFVSATMARRLAAANVMWDNTASQMRGTIRCRQLDDPFPDEALSPELSSHDRKVIRSLHIS